LEIAKLIPAYNRYFEPFLGGGAILFLTAVPGSVASDIYEPLISLWKLIQNKPDKVISDYKGKWVELNSELDRVGELERLKGSGIPQTYYNVRKNFNQGDKDPLDLNFILRTCVNGIVRFNANGEFNNSFHLSRRGMDPKRFENVVYKWHPVIQGVDFVCCDYSEALLNVGKDDFVYLDPPYARNKQRYIESLDIQKFYRNLEYLNSKGVKWALSFDGKRNSKHLTTSIPAELYKRKFYFSSGNSPAIKVLNGPIEKVEEALYLNY